MVPPEVEIVLVVLELEPGNVPVNLILLIWESKFTVVMVVVTGAGVVSPGMKVPSEFQVPERVVNSG